MHGVDIAKKGGEWLGAARWWIQWTFRNGSDVTWGTDDRLEGRDITVSDIERLASDVAAAAINEFRQSPHRFCDGSIAPQNCMNADQLYRVLEGMDRDGLEFLDRDGNSLGMHYHYDEKKGGVIVCRPLRDFTFVQRWNADAKEPDADKASTCAHGTLSNYVCPLCEKVPYV